VSATLLAALLSLSPMPLQGSASEFRFPTEPIGPRTVALGGAGVASTFDAEASLNPAAAPGAHRASLHRFEGYAGYNGFVVAGAVQVVHRVTVGASLRHFDYGKIIEDDLGPGVDDLDVSENAYSLTVAYRVAAPLTVGVNLGHLTATYFGSTTVATPVSVGALFRVRDGTDVGLAVREVGPSAKNEFFATRYPLPSRVRLGVAQHLRPAGQRVTVLADAEMDLHARSNNSLQLGVEWNLYTGLALRTGYANLTNPDVEHARTGRWSAGAGINLGPAELGLAARFGGDAVGTELFFGLDAFR
jgi:hypothetical protein